VIASGTLVSGASAADTLRLLATVSPSKADVQSQMKGVLDRRGAKYTAAGLAAAADDCFAKLATRGRATTVMCGSQSAGGIIQFEIQVATQD
jgi:hypothetical protein